MGAKIGAFKTKDNRQYEVRISGASVVDSEIDLGIPPVVISMSAGDVKYCGFKSTTATVTINTNTPLVDLYAEKVDDIRLTVTNKTDNIVEFDGYVTPFAFDQPCSGINDSVTINAVDLLTARKDVKYTNIGSVHGVDIPAFRIVAEIANRAGITEIYNHVNFYDSIDGSLSDSPLNVLTAQAGFLQDEVSEVDALSSVIRFFGYTGHVMGRMLYLYDEYALANSTSAARFNRYAGLGKYANSTATKFAPDANTSGYMTNLKSFQIRSLDLSIERAYDGVEITPDGSDTSILMPDICDEEQVIVGDGETSAAYINNTHYLRKAVESKILTTGKSTNGTLGSFAEGFLTSQVKSTALGAADWTSGSSLVEMTSVALDIKKIKLPTATGEAELQVAVGSNKSTGYLLWLRDDILSTSGGFKGGTFVHKEGTRYSHTGGKICVKGKVIITSRLDDNSFIPLTDLDKSNDKIWLSPFRVRCGNKHINCVRIDSSSYTHYAAALGDSADGAPYFNGPIISTYTILGDASEGFEYDSDVLPEGQIYIEPTVQEHMQLGYNWFFESLSIEAIGPKTEPFEHNYRALGEKVSTSSLMAARTLYNPSTRALAVVGDYKKPYLGDASGSWWELDTYGILQRQMVARYGTSRPSYKISVSGRVRAYEQIVNNGTMTVDSYDWNPYDNTTTITIS